MHTITHRLASAFLGASLVSSVFTPQFTTEYSAQPNTLENAYKETQIPQDLAFLDFREQTQALQNALEPTLLGETSFVALKIPPNKKQVVMSRMWMFVTAYSSTPDQTDDSPFITASGSHVRDGIVAANFIRFGTKLRMPTVFGDKVFVVEDRMNARYYYKVDIWMRSREEAKQFGAKLLPIEIIKER